MNTGSKHSALSPDQVAERLRTAMAAGNFEILGGGESGRMEFRHGTYLTQTATMLPKRGSITIQPDGDGSLVQYEIAVHGFAKYWMMTFAIVFCWLIFPPLLVSRALNHHPVRLMENLLQSV